jgi:hypothetical protein
VANQPLRPLSGELAPLWTCFLTSDARPPELLGRCNHCSSLSPSQFAVAIAVLVAAVGTTALRAESVSWVARFSQAPLFQAPLFQAPLPSCLANAAGLSESYLEGAAEFFSWFGAGAFGCTSGAPGEPAMGKTIPSQNGFKAEWMARAPPTAAGLRAIAAAC